jgi:hypothetical protein
LYNKPTLWTIYPHFIELQHPFHPGPPTDDLEEKQIPFATHKLTTS